MWKNEIDRVGGRVDSLFVPSDSGRSMSCDGGWHPGPAVTYPLLCYDFFFFLISIHFHTSFCICSFAFFLLTVSISALMKPESLLIVGGQASSRLSWRNLSGHPIMGVYSGRIPCKNGEKWALGSESSRDVETWPHRPHSLVWGQGTPLPSRRQEDLCLPLLS